MEQGGSQEGTDLVGEVRKRAYWMYILGNDLETCGPVQPSYRQGRILWPDPETTLPLQLRSTLEAISKIVPHQKHYCSQLSEAKEIHGLVLASIA